MDLAKQAADFNPRTPCGVRHSTDRQLYIDMIFQSTHPLRGATLSPRFPKRCLWNFNPRTPCGVRLSQFSGRPQASDFNPRTPCGVRPRRAGRSRAPDAISIHAPLAGCDLAGISALRVKTFQSTHPLRGATTGSICFLIYIIRFQSTHPLRGATVPVG